jgi:hypothetical protein
MIAVKLKGTVTKDHRLELTLPPSVPSGEVEVIVLHPEPPPRSRVRGVHTIPYGPSCRRPVGGS